MYADAPDLADVAARAAMTEIARLEYRYSRFLPDSVLSDLNRVAAVGGKVELDSEMTAIVNYAFSCFSKSDGLFDITAGCLRRAWDFGGVIPDTQVIDQLRGKIGMDKLEWQPPFLRFAVPGMELDFGGICKEYAVDRAVEILASHGLDHVLVDLGGDVRVTGPQPDGGPWPIGICHPRIPDALVATVMLIGGGLATSGDYERFMEVDGTRYCHILDPRTGWPVQGLQAVTVLAESCLVAGTVTTIAMLKGHEGIGWLAGLGLPHLWIDAEGRQGGSALPTLGQSTLKY